MQQIAAAECQMPGVEKFVLPLVMGSVQQLRSVQFGQTCNGRITLIARRSVQRPGVRHWRRGADAQVRPPCRSLSKNLALLAKCELFGLHLM